MLNNAAVRGEFDNIIGSNLPAVFWKLSADIIIDNKQEVRARNVISEKVVSDFEGQLSDYRYLSIQIGPSVYERLIQPNRDKLKVRVTRRVQNDTGLPVAGATAIQDTYIAFLRESGDTNMTSNFRNNATDGEKEVSQLVTLTFELVDPTLLELINTETAGIFYDIKTQDLLLSQLCMSLEGNTQTQSLKSRLYRGVRGFQATPATNQKAYSQIEVPTGMRLGALPTYLQNEYGINSSGLGCYYRGGYWYVYPLYNYKLFSTRKRTLSIFNMSAEEAPVLDRSYSVRSDQVFVVSTGNSESVDNSEKVLNNVGDSLRFTPSSSLEKGLIKTTGNKTKVLSKDTVRAIGVNKPHHGVFNTRYAEKVFTDNPYPELSALALSKGQRLSVNWTCADLTLIQPGMAVRVYYLRGDALEYAEGTLLGVTANTSPSSDRLTDNDFRVNCKLILHVEKK